MSSSSALGKMSSRYWRVRLDQNASGPPRRGAPTSGESIPPACAVLVRKTPVTERRLWVMGGGTDIPARGQPYLRHRKIATPSAASESCQERPFRALPKGDALDHLRLADVHIAASAQAYRCEGAGVDSQPFLIDAFLHGEL